MSAPDTEGQFNASKGRIDKERKGVPRKGGARHVPTYHDLQEDFILVNRNHLKELTDFSMLQEGAGAGGMFFLSGPVWLLITLLSEHGLEAKYVPWYVVCFLSMIFGLFLLWMAYINYVRKNRTIDKLFREPNHDREAAQYAPRSTPNIERETQP